MRITGESIQKSRRGNGSANMGSDTPVSEDIDRSWLQEMIATAAYFRAEKRAFVPGNELQDWLQAEAELANRSTLKAN